MSTIKKNIRNRPGKDEEQTLRTLAKYYPLNEEAKTFEIGLRYEKASDLFEEDSDTLERAPRISEGITDRMAEILDDIPKGYSADVSIRVDDFEGYSAEQLMDGLKDALFFRHRRFIHEATRNGFRTGGLVVAGIVLILVLTIGRQIGWWGGDDTASEILAYMLDTLGCVLIWEGLYMAFVEESEEYIFERKISHKISSICFYQENNDSVSASESRESISAVVAINRKKLVTKRLLLISSCSLICLAVAWVLQTLGIIINPARFGEKVTSKLILDMLVAFLAGVAGVLSLRAFAEKLRNSPIVLMFAALIFYPIVNAFITLFKEESKLAPIQTILAILIIAAGLAFLVGYVMYYTQYRIDTRDHSEKNK